MTDRLTPSQEWHAAAGVSIHSRRRTGRTTRVLWNALLAASEKDWSDVVVVVWNRHMETIVLDMLKALAGPACFKVEMRERRMVMPNGSTIQVRFRDLDDLSGRWERTMAGRAALVFHDHTY